MIVSKSISEIRQARWANPTLTWGLVTTMGALHAGHASLVERSVKENDKTCATIFVNPTQFAPTDDLDKYPRPLERDLELLEAAGVDLVFTPTPDIMYPAGFGTRVLVDGVTDMLEGEHRPGHFDGVTQVVTKLFNIAQPNRAYFGQKDVQQTVVLKKMVRDLNFNLDLIVCPTVREPDGLAMSSRNQYLDSAERKRATILYKALSRAADIITDEGVRDAELIRQMIAQMVAETAGADLIYASVASGRDLVELETISGDIVISLAVMVGTTRLIDNFLLEGLSETKASN